MREAVVAEAQRGQLFGEWLSGRTARALGGPSAADRQALVDTLIGLIDGLYVHLPLKRAMYGQDPVQRLRLLRERLADPGYGEAAFHAELSGIMTSLRDAHTRYVGPSHWRDRVALLPFMVESYGPPDAPRFLASHVTAGHPAFAGTDFAAGVELIWWNGMPMARAVERYADRETGGRPDARRARALESLTFRSLGYGPPPDEHWVQVGYRTPEGPEREIRVDWRVVEIVNAGDLQPAGPSPQRAYAGNPAAEMARRAKTLLFAPAVWDEQATGATASVRARALPADGEWIRGRFPDNVAAKVIETAQGRFGYLRIWSFDLLDDAGFLAEVTDMLAQLPSRGLIVDVRANPGGLVWAAERLLQLFTPHAVAPARFSFVATHLTRAMANAPQNAVQLAPWRQSLDAAVAYGEPYSRSAPLTPPALCGDVGQVYGGPVVCVVDANTYSAGDLFAAGFVDNRVGMVVAVDEATGGGGANVWMPLDVARALSGTPYAIPARGEGAAFTIAVRRAVRSGGAEGVLIEDLGVPGHFRHALTRRDLVDGNADLLEYCAALLASEPVTDLRVGPIDGASLAVSAEGLDRVDLYVDGRPIGTFDPGHQPLLLPVPPVWAEATVLGYSGDSLRQRRIVRPAATG